VGYPDLKPGPTVPTTLAAAREALDDAVVVADARQSDVATVPGGPAALAAHLRVTLAWAGAEPLLRGRAYTLQAAGQRVTATVAPIRYRLDLPSGEHVPATSLAAGEVGVCELDLSEPVTVAPADLPDKRETFALLDTLSGATVGLGRIQFALRRDQNLSWHELTVDKAARAARLGQRPTVVWLTGRPGAGKSTIANLVESELHRRGHHTYVLDGDNVRHGLNGDLGFTAADRAENIRRVAEVARLMVDAGLIVIVSFISPFRAERSMARSRFAPDDFVEVYVDASLELAEQRDPKGLYRKARRGELANFTGIDSPYEPPESAEVHLDTATLTAEEAAQRVIAALSRSDRLV
jgi:bifunctional enzyme CysN/CysC